MSTRTRVLAAVLAAAALSLTGCVPVLGMPGPRVSEDRDIEAVESVVLKTGGDLRVTLGDTPTLRITAPDNQMGRLSSDIVDGELVLGARGPFFGTGEIDYELVVPRISDVAVEGSGDVAADFTGADRVTIAIEGSGDIDGAGIDAAEVIISIDGSGDIAVDGSAGAVQVEISGAGNVDAQDLIARAARVEISGSGDVAVHATGTLDAEISGSGKVRCSGDPSVTSDISGSGEVVQD